MLFVYNGVTQKRDYSLIGIGLTTIQKGNVASNSYAGMTQIIKSAKSRKLKTWRAISVFIIVLGIILLVYMITVEDEPGALPLFLILSGTVGFIVIRAKIKKQLK